MDSRYDIAILKMSEAPANAIHGLLYMKKATNVYKYMVTYCAGFNEQCEFQSSFGKLDIDSGEIIKVTNETHSGFSGGPCVGSRDSDLVGMIKEVSRDNISGYTVIISGLIIQLVIETAQHELPEENIPAFEDKTFKY
jgi:hypothetical protein